jgi:hypothetical protein
VVAWGILQLIDVVGEPLNLPGWFATVIILLLAIGSVWGREVQIPRQNPALIFIHRSAFFTRCMFQSGCSTIHMKLIMETAGTPIIWEMI